MIYLIIAFTLLCCISGFYRLFMMLFRLPSLKAYSFAKKMLKVNRGSSSFELFMQEMAELTAKRLVINEDRLIKLSNMLRYYDDSVSAEMFMARRIVSSAMIIASGLPFLVFFPAATIGLSLLGIINYLRVGIRLEDNYNKKRQEIELELPRFCATILQEIKSGRDVVGIMERYIRTGRRALKQELEITVADMKSSNYEAALVRLESRLSIGMVSDIVRGLIGVVRGDDTLGYFEMLSYDLDAQELQRLEAEAAKQPNKIKKYQFFILAAMIFMYVITIAVYLLQMERPAYL